ncbi:hypothetical protein EP227_02250 [bacterium]|nr:MAG: hypothetical protein EP227_02250 [bacterium]
MRILFFFLFILTLVPVISCSEQKIVEEHFKDHGLAYPVDSTGLGLLDMEYTGIGGDELEVPGARDFIAKGLMFIKDYFKRKKIRNYIPGTYAVVLSKPVLFRDEGGNVGLMVRVTAYGAGQPVDETNGIVTLLDRNRHLWTAENFAYFFRNDLYQWEYGGMVYP